MSESKWKRCNQCWKWKSLVHFEGKIPGRIYQDCLECRGKRSRHLTVLDHRTSLPPGGPLQVKIIPRSHNRKLGPIPEVYVAASTCPPSCRLFNHGCYGESGLMREHWREASDDREYMRRWVQSWDELVTFVRGLPMRQLWRYAVVGDLPGRGEAIDDYALTALVAANHGKRGFTFTHKRSSHALDAVQYCNANGFTVNLSADTLEEADQLWPYGPVAVLLPGGCARETRTPVGRLVRQCPATYKDWVDCSRCGICADRHRARAIVGFPAHGLRQREVSEIATGVRHIEPDVQKPMCSEGRGGSSAG